MKFLERWFLSVSYQDVYEIFLIIAGLWFFSSLESLYFHYFRFLFLSFLLFCFVFILFFH